ncbi:hypothetical protein C8Q80DRAFT_1101205 [Daedaleopsis nitida]|nr:hypothetical protein C8Q80DRAFT_1101205 [Daedaleopsis nitida]
MGRRAKHLTTQAKQAAKRRHAEMYRQSEKGRETKSRANRRSYEQQKTSSPSVATPLAIDIDIPPEISARGCKALHVSFAHLRIDTGPLLGLWTVPYMYEPPLLGTLHDEGGTVGEEEDVENSAWTSRAAILGTFQYGEIMAAGSARARQWEEEDLRVLRPGLVKEVNARVTAWVTLKDSGRESDEDRGTALDWGAKLICLLVDEWDVRREGVEGYSGARRTGDLPWQRFRKDTMRWMNEDA